MFGNSYVAERLAASQGGLSSMELYNTPPHEDVQDSRGEAPNILNPEI
jgi:hypothetical protein